MDPWGCWARAAATAHLQHVPLWLLCVPPCARCNFTASFCSYTLTSACDVPLSWAEKQRCTYLYMLHIFSHAPTFMHQSSPKLTKPSYPASPNLPPWRSFLPGIQCFFTRVPHTFIVVGKLRCSLQMSLYVRHFS